MGTTLLGLLALVLSVGVGVREAWRRDVSGAMTSLSIALLMAALLFPGRATMVLVALGVLCFVWGLILRRRNRTTAG